MALPSLDQDLLVSGIQRIVSDQELRGTLRARGIEHVKGFTWQRCAQQTLRCYEQALGELAG